MACKNLLVMDSYFSTIENSEYRTIINKKGKIQVLKNKKNRMAPAAQPALIEILETKIKQNLSQNKESWRDKKIWLAPELEKYTVPLQQRAASEGLITVGRGSRIPFDTGKVLRLFVYWKQTERETDLDLSVIKYDEDMNYAGHVSFTNLKAGGIVHSGDITSAPEGAAEFIDIDLTYLKEQNSDKAIRYIAPEILRYGGESFPELLCFAGWMIREKVDSSYQSFDIKTVQNKFDLGVSASYAVPMLVDLKENEIIFVDLYIGKKPGNNTVEGAHNQISLLSRELARFLDTRPNMITLARYNIQARGGTLVENLGEADITIGLKDCDYNVTQLEKILNEFI